MSNTPSTGRICPRGASYYIWQSGDTLQSVALANGVTEQAIRLINEGVDFSTVAAGDTICMPPQQLTCLSGQLYTVKAGDTFQSIAQAYGITTLELAERNPYVSPGNLLAGQVLCVPAQVETPAPTPPPPAFSCPIGYSAGQVRTGQTFADLLIDNNVSYQAMRLANPSLEPNNLRAGQRYCAPPAGSRRLCASGSRSYVMTTGDTLASVAALFNTTQGTLLRLNMNLAPNDFQPGMVICVP